MRLYLCGWDEHQVQKTPEEAEPVVFMLSIVFFKTVESHLHIQLALQPSIVDRNFCF
jgi:hypothetical protein